MTVFGLLINACFISLEKIELGVFMKPSEVFQSFVYSHTASSTDIVNTVTGLELCCKSLLYVYKSVYFIG